MQGHAPLKATRVSITAPDNFSFSHTIFSHGWCGLPPFSFNRDTPHLQRVVQLIDGTIFSCTITSNKRAIDVHIAGTEKPTPRQRNGISAVMKTCLRLDEDFAGFHAEARRHPKFRWIALRGAGRMLRSPTVFEDAVKMICTTNCTWELTTLMVTNLVHMFGTSLNGSFQTFPTPEAIAGTTERILRKEIKAGYRSPYILEFAERVASKKTDVEEWRTSSLSTDQLFKKIIEIKGIGPYAAGNILKLIGRYDYLGLDSWVRAKYYEIYRNGRTVKDATIERDYVRYGKWRGLFFWLDMTRHWHDQKFPL
jgi:3-methyladenine DNA glycosylase/8-oxoguanine DNA glycosylase